MQSRRRFLGLALAGVVAAVGVAACGSDSKSSAARRQHRGGRRRHHHGRAADDDGPHREGDAAARLLPEHHPRHRAGRRGQGHLPGQVGRERHVGDLDVQRRHQGLRGPGRRRHRRHLHRPQPGHQPVAEVGRQGDQDRVRLDVGRRLLRREAGDQQTRPTSRARRWPARAWATRKTSPCARG